MKELENKLLESLSGNTRMVQHNDITQLSDNEIGFDIWLFELDKDSRPHFKGIYRDGVIQKLTALGYYKRFRNNNSYIFIQQRDNIIWEVEPHMMKDEFFEKAMQNIEFEYKKHRISVSQEKLKETYLNQHHLIFNDKFLEHLPTHAKPIIKDTKDSSFFFFKNQIIKITESELQTIEYSSINNQCIWRTQIIERNFIYNKDNANCHFVNFVKNICNHEPDRLSAIRSAIGYVLHNYSHPSKGQAVIAYDEEITDLKNPAGGTGKGLFANSFKQLRNLTKIDGKKFDPSDKFKYQDITESTQVVWLDDVKPELGFETFHSVLTDGWSVEKKYKNQFFIKAEDSPKMLICSNAILNDNGTTNKRRQFIVEFSNHYSKHIKIGNEEPIKDEHGCIFFDDEDWNNQEWNMFFSFMLDCVQAYFIKGLQSYSYRGLNRNKLLQLTNEDFCTWVNEQEFEVNKQYNTKDFFENYRDTYYSPDSELKQRGFTNFLKRFAESKNLKLIAKTSNNIQYFSFIK